MYIGGKLKPLHIPGIAGTHQSLNLGTLAPLCPRYPQPEGGGVKMTGAQMCRYCSFLLTFRFSGRHVLSSLQQNACYSTCITFPLLTNSKIQKEPYQIITHITWHHKTIGSCFSLPKILVIAFSYQYTAVLG